MPSGTDGGRVDGGRDAAPDAAIVDAANDAGEDSAVPGPLLDYAAATCTRDSEATYFDPSVGTLVRYAPNVPRILDDGSIYLEGPRTSLLGWSQEIERGIQVASAATANVVTAPDGTMTAERWDATADPNARIFRNSLSFGASLASNSVFARALSAPEEFRLYYQSPSGTNQWSSNQSATMEWRRFTVTSADMSRNGIWQSTNVAARSLGLWGLQSELGAFASQYIEAGSSATVTREADDCSFAAAPGAMLTARWSVELAPEASAAQILAGAEVWTVFEFGDPAAAILLAGDAGAVRVRVNVGGGVHVESMPLSFEADDVLTVEIDPAAGTLAVAGAASGDGVETASAWAFPSGPLYVGRSSADTQSYFGRLGRPADN